MEADALQIRIPVSPREVALVRGGQLGEVCVVRALDESLLDINVWGGAGGCTLVAQLGGGQVELELGPRDEAVCGGCAGLDGARAGAEVGVARVTGAAAAGFLGDDHHVDGEAFLGL